MPYYCCSIDAEDISDITTIWVILFFLLPYGTGSFSVTKEKCKKLFPDITWTVVYVLTSTVLKSFSSNLFHRTELFIKYSLVRYGTVLNTILPLEMGEVISSNRHNLKNHSFQEKFNREKKADQIMNNFSILYFFGAS